MNPYKLHKKIPLKWLIVLTVIMVATILIIGLKPKDLFQFNNANWLTDRPGIRFGKYGIAYTDSITDLIQAHVSPQQSFSIEIALKPKSFHEEGFSFIFLIHGGHDRNQFVIGQWRSSLIVMNGDDYDYHRKTKRITFKSKSSNPNLQLLTVTTGTEGSKIYIDGKLVKSRKDLHLVLPDKKADRLVLGNSVYGNHPWKGEIYGVAVYGKSLSQSDVNAHFQAFSENRLFSFTRQYTPFIMFPLEENGGTLANNQSDGIYPLHVPSRMKMLSPRIFPRGRLGLMFDRSIFTNQDALLNFFGFIPFGILLSATLIRSGENGKRHAVIITLLAGFFVSLLIETIQAWMPDRSSDIQDLILNTAGTLVGAVSCKYFTRAQRGN